MRYVIRRSAAVLPSILFTVWTCSSIAADISADIQADIQADIPEIALENDPLYLTSCPPLNKIFSTTSSQSSNADKNESGYLYQAGLNPVTGSGSLKKIQRAFAESDGIDSLGRFEWDAATLLTKRVKTRRIYTGSFIDDRFSGIPFIWPSLSTEQKDLLHRSSRDGNNDQLGEERLNYLRGNRLHETDKRGNGFPSRDQLLGAIVHGVPKYIGAPSATLDGHSYQDYFEANRARPPVVYVGTGNGMLHAFDANRGKELFAYIPEALFSRLPELTTLSGARALPLDGGIDVAEVHVENKWKSVLVAGMGRSAQGVFALDVTEPEDFDADDVLWEFTDATDVDIGNVVGMPVIAKFKTSLTNGKPQYRYFAVVANGVNNYQADGQSNAAASNALFLLALDKRRTEPWVAGVNYFKFTLPISDARSANGMSDVALVRIADGSVSHGYAGDMQGNLWRFDFSGLPPWPNVLGSKPPQPLFVARDAGGKRQPISQKPHAVYAPANGHVVLFGTGKYLEQNDLGKNAYTMQSFYAVWDDDGKRIAGRSELTERTLLPSDDGNTLEIGGGSFQYGMSAAGDKGWYVDFIDSAKTGERSVSPASLFDSLLAFRTLIPDSNRCAKPTGRFYVLNTLTGLPAAASFTGELSDAGFPGVPIIVSTAPTEIAERDATGKRRVTRKLEISDSDSPTQKETSPGRKTIVETVMTAGRLSWREIVNWVELRSGK